MPTPNRFLACGTVAFRREPLEVAIERSRHAGYDAIDLCIIRDFCPHWDPVETTERLTTAFVEGLRASGPPVRAVTAAPPFEFAPVAQGKIAIQYAEESVKLAARLGASVISFPCFDPASGSESPDAKRARIGAALKRLVLAGDAAGIRVAVEAPAPISLCPDLDSTERLLTVVGDQRLALAFDSAHAAACGLRPEEAFTALAPRVAHVQLRDRGPAADAVPGEGAIDFDALFASVAESGYAGGFTVELLSSELELDVRAAEAARAREFVRPRLAERGLL